MKVEKFGKLTVKVIAIRSPMNLYRVPMGRICHSAGDFLIHHFVVWLKTKPV